MYGFSLQFFYRDTFIPSQSLNFMQRIVSYKAKIISHQQTQKYSEIDQSLRRMNIFLNTHTKLKKKVQKSWDKLRKSFILLTRNIHNDQLIESSFVKKTLQLQIFFKFLKESENIRSENQKHLEKISESLLSSIKSRIKNNHQNSRIFQFDVELYFRNKIHFFDPRYFCSSKYVIYGGKVNSFQFQSHFLKMKKEQVSEKFLEIFLCAAMNSSRSYLTVGIDQNNIIRGQIFQEEEKEEIRKKIDEKTKKVFPNIPKHVRSKFIPVCQFQGSMQKQFIEGLFVLLIEFNEVCKNIFYFINEPNTLIKGRDELIYISKQHIYESIRQYFKKPRFKIVHDQCVQPEIGSILVSNKIQQLDQFLEYQHLSILIIPSYKHPEYLHKLISILKQNKITCKTFLEPFPELNQQKVKIIWLLNHQDRHKVIQDFLEKYDKEKCIQFHCLLKNIILRDERLKEKQAEFFHEFSKLFSLKHIKQEVRKWKKEKKVQIFLRCQYWYQALFTFLYFLKFNFMQKFETSEKIKNATMLIKQIDNKFL